MNDESKSSPPSNNNQVISRKVPAARGKVWLTDAWSLFKQYPMAWIATTFVMFIIMLLLLVVPLIQLVLPAASTIFLGGLMLGCRAQKQNKPFEISFLFKGFEHETSNLLIAGLLYLGGLMLCSTLAVGVSSLIGFEVKQLTPEELQQLMQGAFDIAGYFKSLLIPMLFFLAFLVPLLMAFWFVPALIIINKVKPVEAYKLSFKACNQNIGSFMVYGLYGFLVLIMYVFLIVLAQSITLYFPLLGVPITIMLELSLMALMIISIYTSYVDIFPDLEEPNSLNEESETPTDPPGQLTL